MMLQPVPQSAAALPGVCDLRLTLSATEPVTSADMTSQGTIYALPYRGNRVSLYDGSKWSLYSVASAGVSLSLSGLTANANYDLFLYDDAGTLRLECSAAWSNDTTRSDALARQDGVLVKSGSPTRRWLGLFRASSATTTEDSGGGSGAGGVEARRFLCNAYHRVPKACRIQDSTNEWTYATNDWRAANNSSSMRASFVQADDSFAIEASYLFIGWMESASNGVVGIGVDSTSAFSGVTGYSNTGAVVASSARWAGNVAAGFHFVAALERQISGTGHYQGDNNNGASIQSGLTVILWV